MFTLLSSFEASQNFYAKFFKEQEKQIESLCLVETSKYSDSTLKFHWHWKKNQKMVTNQSVSMLIKTP